MEFRPSSDQEALQAGVRSFCDGRVPADALPDLAKRGGFDRALWSELADLGVFGLRVPESEGGVGLGGADAVLVFEELGRRLVPGPLLWSHLAAGLVPGAASGEVVVGGLDAASEPCLVEHLDALDVLLVLREGALHRVDPRALEAQPIEFPLDPLTPLHHVVELPRGERIAGVDGAELRRVGTALAAAQLLGIAVATQELATAYAKQREQFGRPIGSFQAIKHLLADAFVRQEVARATVYAAGAILDDPGAGDVERATGGAKLVAGEAALRNARTCIQVHGGMGYTWEVPAHFYLKRTWVLESVFGTGEAHAARLAGRL